MSSSYYSSLYKTNWFPPSSSDSANTVKYEDTNLDLGLGLTAASQSTTTTPVVGDKRKRNQTKDADLPTTSSST